MKSFRRILRVPWTEKRTNVSILQQLGNVDENWLLNTVVQRKLAYFGHVKSKDLPTTGLTAESGQIKTGPSLTPHRA